MAVSKAPAPPPGLEGSKAPGHSMPHVNLQAYAMQGRPWTPMGGVPGGNGAVAPNDVSHQSMSEMPRAFGSASYPPVAPWSSTKQSAAAKAALNLFKAPDEEERKRLEQAAKANARRLLNSPLHKVGAKATSTANQTPAPRSEELKVDPAPRQEPLQVSESVSSGAPRYTGVLKVFKPESGYGFIENEELKQKYGCDVFMNQGIEGGIVVGSVVSFTLELNKSGKPQAREAKLEAEKSEQPLEEETGPKGADVLGKVFKGTVKSFNISRGFGFLTCRDLIGTPYAGRDIYVSQTQVPGHRPLSTGHEVDFVLSVNQQGQPQGKDLRMTNTTPELDYLGELPTAQSVGDKLLKMA
mgnify:FL=1